MLLHTSITRLHNGWLENSFMVLVYFVFLAGQWQKPEDAAGQRGNPRAPNNFVARFIRTVDAALGKQQIFRFGIFALCSFLAIYYGWFFMYSFLLLDVIFQSPMLQNVIKAVTIPGKSLLLTTMVGVIVMYNYAFV